MKVTECTARTLRQGDAISELEAQGEDLEIAMAKAERALEGIGVSIRGETADSLRDIEDIIGDVANAWDTLSDSERQAVSEAMAGTQRSSMFSALIENYDKVLELQDEGLNSFGELAEANQKRVESFEGQLNILKDKMLAFTDGLQPLIFGSVELGNKLLDLVNAIGTIPTVVGLASASFLSFSDSGQKVKNTLMEMLGSKIQLVDGFNQIISAQNQRVESAKNEVAIAKQQISSTIETIAKLRLEHSARNDNTEAIAKQQQALVGLNKGLVASQKELAMATLKATAFQAALSLGLTAVISGLVWGLGKLWTSLKDGGINLDSVNAKFKELNSSQIELSKTVANLDGMVGKYEELEQQMKNSQKGSEEYKQAEENLLTIQKQLAENYPSLVSYIDEEGNAYATNLDSIKNYTEAQRELLQTQKEALESTAKTNKPKLEVELGELETDRDKIKEKIDYYTQQIEDLETKMANSGNAIFKTLAKGDIAMFTSEKNRLIEKLTETNEKISETSETLVGYEQILQDTSEKTEKATESTNKLANSMEELEGTTPMKDLNESYLEAVENIAEAQDLLDSFKDGLDASELRNIFDSELMKDYNGALTDTVSIQEYLNEKIKEMENASNEAYNNMLKQDENYWNTKMKNSETWANYEQETQNEMVRIAAEALGVKETDFQNYINEKGGMRDVDLSNAKNMADAERILNGDLNSQVLGFFSKFINEKADARVDDMDNVVAFLKAQNTEEVKTIQQLAKLWNDYYNAKRTEISNALTATKNVTMTLNKAQQQIKDEGIKKLEASGLKMPGVKDHYSSLYDQSIKTVQGNKTQVEELNKQLQALEKENNTFTSLMNGLKGYNASNSLKQDYVNANKGNFVGSSSNVSNSNKGSGSSTNKGSSSSSSSKETEKEVEDLDLKIDKYQELEEAINRVDEALTRNQQAQETVTTKAELKKLLEEEVKLMERKKKAIGDLQTALKSEQQSLKKQLEKSGLKFDGDELVGDKKFGTVAKRLEDAQKWANSAKGAEKEWRKNDVLYLQESIERYYELMNQLGDVNAEYKDMELNIKDVQEEQEELLKQLEKMGDRYFYITHKIAQVENAISMNQALQSYADEERKIELMREEIALIKQRQELVKQNQAEVQKEANELKAQLIAKGVTFDENGGVANYDTLINSLESKANSLVGDAQDEAVEDIEDLLDLINQYTELIDETIPELGVAWQEYANEMQSIQDAIEDIYQQQKETAVQTQKDIASAYEKYLTDRYNKLKEALNKERDAYNKTYGAENFQRELAEEQRTLDEIAQQIAIYERDTSAIGQARLEQLRKEYEEQQKAINDMIRDQEKSKTDEAFDKATEDLDKELEDALSPENVADMVNQALASGFVTIGDSVVELNGLMTQWIDETGDGLYLLGDTIKSEMIDNLQQARDLIKELDSSSSWSKMIGLSTTKAENLGRSVPQAISFAFNQPLVNVEGNADSSVLDTISSQVTTQINSMEQRIYQEIKNVLT